MTAGVRDASFVFVSRATVMILGMGNQSCLAWLLGPAGRGSYAVAMLFMTLLSQVFTFGCHIALEVSVASKKLTPSEGVTYGLIFAGGGTALSLVAGFILMQMPLAFFQKAPRESFYLAMLLLPIVFLSLLFRRFIASMSQFGMFAAFSIGSASLQLTLTYAFLKFLDPGVNGAMIAAILTASIVTLVVLGYLRVKYGIRLVKPSLIKLKATVSFAFRYYLGSISNQVNLRLGTLLLAFFTSADEIGLFAVAALLATQVEMIPDSLGTAILPRVAIDGDGRRELVARCARLSAIVCGFLLLALVVFAEPIVALVFSRAFLPIVPLVRILAAGVFMRCCSKIFAPYLLGMNHPGLASFAVMAGITANLAGLWSLLPVLGLAGAAVAMSAGYLVSSTILMYFFTRISSLSIQDTWRFSRGDWKMLGRFLPKGWA